MLRRGTCLRATAALNTTFNKRSTRLGSETVARGDGSRDPNARDRARGGAIGAMLKGLTGGFRQVRGRQGSTARIDGELRPMLRGQRIHGHTRHAMLRAGADGD